MAARGAPLKAPLSAPAADAASRVRDVFCRVLALRPSRREAAARRLCGADPGCLPEVLRLLRHTRDVESDFLEPPPPVPDVDPRASVGRVVGGRWKLVGLLGRGAAGTVFEAHDVETARRVAVKLVHGLSDESIRAARREIALLRWLRLPGVVQLIDDGTEDGAVFCVTELVEGTRFPGTLDGSGWRALAPAALALLEAVASIHEAGIVHCDLKPQNVLVDARGVVTILDLGISAEARAPFVSKPGVYAGGTRDYAAPEQLRGAVPGVRWDLYALGVMLFEALAGRYPGPDPARECARLAAPAVVRRTIAALLDTDPSRRPEGVREVLAAIHPAPAARLRRRPWTEEELRSRFAGPDLLLHLREDAAAELFRRTRGRPRAVEEEIRSWIRSGLARESDGLVVVDRPALERLATIAAARGDGARRDAAERAFARALRRGTPRGVARAALRLASRRVGEGRPSAALAVLFEGAAAARVAGDPELELRVLVDAASAALRTGVSAELDRALLLLQRASVDGRRAVDVEAVLRAAVHIAAGRPVDALASTRWVCGRSRDRSVLRLAWSVRLIAAQMVGLHEERRSVRALRTWFRRRRDACSPDFVHASEGWLRFHESRYADSVRLHLAAAREARDELGRVRSTLDAAMASLYFDVRQAKVFASSARSVAASMRNPGQEGRAVLIERAVLHRSGVGARADPEFAEVAARLGNPALAATAAFGEAAIAWRSGDMRTARVLAQAAASRSGRAPHGDLARSLAAATGADLRPDEFSECSRTATDRLPAAVGMQMLALLGVARPGRRSHCRKAFLRLVLPRHDRDERPIREVMSISEARELLFSGSLAVRGRRRRVPGRTRQ